MGEKRWGTARLMALLVLASACSTSGSGSSGAPAPGAGSPAAAPQAPGPADQPSKAQKEPVKVSSAYVSAAPNMAPAWLALEQGIFAKYGLDVDLSYIAGASRMAQALVAGSIDIAVTPSTSAIGPGVEGADTVMVAAWTRTVAFSMEVHPDIKTPADLKGKNIGTTRVGSNSDIWLRAILKRFGLEADRDYFVISAGGQNEQVAALETGAIQAATLIPPQHLRAIEAGFPMLFDPTDQRYHLPLASTGLVTTRRYLAANRDTVVAFAKACAEAVALQFNDPATTKRIMGQYLKIEDQKALDVALAFENGRTSRTMEPEPEGLKMAVELMAAEGDAKVRDADPNQFVDFSIVKELKDSGFIDRLYPPR